MATYTYKILMRNDTVANWTLTGSTILEQGEIGVAFSGTTFYGMKIGDGTSSWDTLDYIYDFYTKSEIQSNYLDTGTTISDLNGYSQAYLNLEFARLDTSGLTNYYTKSEVYTKTQIDNNFISLNTSGLTNYYLTGDTYTKIEVNNLISGFTTGSTDLSDYYTKTEVDNNFLSGNTTITDLSGYTQNYIDTNFMPIFTGFTGNLNLSGQTGQVVLNITNGIITSTGNTWI